MNVEQTDGQVATINLTAIWAGTIFGIHLSDLVLIVTLVYTLLQTYVLIRDKLRIRRSKKDDG